MREVLGAVIAAGLVLVAVFIPVSFFPGTTGRLYAQFSITIAFAVALSVFNAVTLTPALSALLLDRESHHKGRIFSLFERLIARGTAIYVGALRWTIRMRWAVAVVFLLSLGATWWMYQVVPRAFVPEEDQAFLMVQVQAPPGASLEYTGEVAKQAEAIILNDPDVLALFSVMGFSFAGAAPNQGLMFVRLKPLEMRPDKAQSSQAVQGRLAGQLFAIPGAIVVPFNPPSIPGLSRFGGFEFQVLDQSGGDITNLAQATQAIAMAGNRSDKVRGLFTSFTANDPQLQVTIDRQRALALGLPLSEITSALQIFLGSQYVNDFELNNRAYRVYVQADQQFRSNPQALTQLYARTRGGEMVPLEQVVRVEETTAPQVISHFNLFRSATISGSAAPGVSSGDALAEMERLAETTLPAGMGYAWSGMSLEETKAGRQAVLIFGLGVLLDYLTLAAQYESLVLPFIVLLGVPLAVLGGLGAQWLRGLTNDVYCQVGLVILVGLAAKNAILIVEFAEQLRDRGLSVADAAVEASRIRLRPILMTSLTFILAVIPLAFATGAGQAARQSVGTTVGGGMVLSTFLNVIIIPVLYVIVQTLRGGATRHGQAPNPA
jgi:HAE1 family hydrophobic/amphiphilic exporter-1